MLRSIKAVSAACLVLIPAAAWSDTATDARAKAVEEAIRTFGPDEWAGPGMVRVSAEGESFRLVFDTARIAAAAVAPWTIKDASPIGFRISEQAGGQWAFDSSGALAFSAEYLAANRSNGLSLSLGSSEIRGLFDPVAIFPKTAEIGFTDGTATIRAAQDSVRLQVGDYRLKSAVQDEKQGRGDVEATFAAHGVSAVLGTFPNPEIKLSAAQVKGDYRIGALALDGIGAIARFWQTAKSGEDASSLDQDERARLQGILNTYTPMLHEIGGSLVATDLAASQGGKGFRVEKLDYLSRWEGMDGAASLVMGATIANASIDPGIWPAGLDAALPRHATLNVRFSGFDLGALWEEARLVRSAREQAMLPRDHASKLVFPDRTISLDISDSAVRGGFYDLALSGQMKVSVDSAAAPTGTLRFVARDFDRTIKHLQDNAQAVPLFARAAFLALMMKGLGKVEPDGAVAWDVTFDETGKMKVNGQALPM